jgi:hypothetical protein
VRQSKIQRKIQAKPLEGHVLHFHHFSLWDFHLAIIFAHFFELIGMKGELNEFVVHVSVSFKCSRETIVVDAKGLQPSITDRIVAARQRAHKVIVIEMSMAEGNEFFTNRIWQCSG